MQCAAIASGCILRKCAANEGQRTGIIVYPAAAAAGLVGGDVCLADRQEATVEDRATRCPRKATSGLAAAEGQLLQRQVATAGHMDQPEGGGSAVACDRGAVADDCDLAGDVGQPVGAIDAVVYCAERIGAAGGQGDGVRLAIAIGGVGWVGQTPPNLARPSKKGGLGRAQGGETGQGQQAK